MNERIATYWTEDAAPMSLTGKVTSLGEMILSKEHYLQEITELTRVQTLPEMSHQRAKYLFIYVVQLVLMEKNDFSDIYDLAVAKVNKFLIDHASILSTEEGFGDVVRTRIVDEVEVLSTGKRGWKKIAAIAKRREIWDDDNPAESRRALKQYFIDELEMTDQGATTYLSITRRALAA